jgi:hypothetical protein
MKIEYYNKDSSHAGLTYGQWTVEWWKWALSNPSIRNPVVDQTGKYSAENQPEHAWFLAGIFHVAEENEKKKFPLRQCTMPSDIPILIPILNCAADPMHYPHLEKDEDIIDYVSNQAEMVDKIECYVNGESIHIERVSSEPKIFDLYVHPDFDKFHIGGNTHASADGYWVFLKPLVKGKYKIKFSGSYENDRFASGATYDIDII